MSERSDENPAGSVKRILSAALFAAERHRGQKRKGAAGEPYINHLIEVAELVAGSSNTLDTELVMAALLHDTVEDTSTSGEELERLFGADVAALVLEVTDDKSLPKEVRKALQISDRAYVLETGSVVKSAPAAELLDDPSVREAYLGGAAAH